MGLFYDPSTLLGHISEMVRSAELQNADRCDIRATLRTSGVAHSWSPSLRRSLDRDVKLCTAHEKQLPPAGTAFTLSETHSKLFPVSRSLESLPPRT